LPLAHHLKKSKIYFMAVKMMIAAASRAASRPFGLPGNIDDAVDVFSSQ
jgi:hypothetical protein